MFPKTRGQIYLELLIVMPVLTIMILGAVQFVLLSAARSSLQLSAYNLSRQIMMDPLLVNDFARGKRMSVFSRPYFEAMKPILPICPEMTDKIFGALNHINSYVRWEGGGKALGKIKNKLDALKSKGAVGDIATLIDKAMYCTMYTKFYVQLYSGKPVDLKKMADQLKKDVPVFGPPRIYRVSVKMKYPLLPIFGKMYCTWFTISKDAIIGRIDDWIDEQMNSVNMYVSDRVNSVFDRVVSGTVGKLKPVTEKLNSYVDSLEHYKNEVTAKAERFFAKTVSYVTRAKGMCREVTAAVHTERIETQYQEVMDKLSYYRDSCYNLGEEQLEELSGYLKEIKGYRDDVARMKDDVVSKAREISNDIGEMCSYGDRVKDYMPPVEDIPELPCGEISAPCQDMQLDLSDFQPPDVDADEYVAYFGVGDKALNSYNRITQSTEALLGDVERKSDSLSDACSRAIATAETSCGKGNQSIASVKEKVGNVENQIEEVTGKYQEECNNFAEKTSSYVNQLDSVNIPDFQPDRLIEEIKSNRNKGCGELDRVIKGIDGSVGKVIRKVKEVKQEIKDKCDSVVGKVEDMNNRLYDSYREINASVDNVLEYKVYLDPEKLLREKYDEYTEKFWGYVYDKERKIKQGLRKTLTRSIPEIPQISVVDYKKCDPALYYLGIYAVSITASEWVPVDFATLRGISEDEIRKRIH